MRASVAAPIDWRRTRGSGRFTLAWWAPMETRSNANTHCPPLGMKHESPPGEHGGGAKWAIPGSLAQQYVAVKFGAVVVKGANYAHYQVLVDR